MTGAPLPAFDPQAARANFPALMQQVHGKPLVYLDNAATTQLPQGVIDAVAQCSRSGRGNVRRGVHALSERATGAYEAARKSVQRLLNAREPREIVFVRGTTEAINLVAYSWGHSQLQPGDRVVVSEMEHHSNLVPWQLLCERRGARLVKLPVAQDGSLQLDAVPSLLEPPTKLLALSHVSNALGWVNPVEMLVAECRARGVTTVIDGAQAAAHFPIDVQTLGCDFYAFSGHKLYGPSGSGVLYGRAELLTAMPPFMSGGDMVESVSFERTRFDQIPHKFEAGTPNLEGAVGLGRAVEYLAGHDRGALYRHERALVRLMARRLRALEGVRVLGCPEEQGSLVSFVVEGVHPHDVGTVLDQQGIAVRAGHHCAQPLLERLGLKATVRASVALYNTESDIDALLSGLERVREMFA